MEFRLTLEQATVKQINSALQSAIARRDTRQMQRWSAIQMLGDNQPVAVICTYLAVHASRVYRWQNQFLCYGVSAAPVRVDRRGRPAKLTKHQKRRIVALVSDTPEAAGYTTGCWTRALVQTRIVREFGVRYSVGYVSELLRNLGFSYQKAHFVSDHLDADARQRWLTETWPTVVAEARARNALLLFGDDVSFAQWGSLGYTWTVRGPQPTVKTTGVRKGYTVFGVVDYFTGQLFTSGGTIRVCAATYRPFLETVLTQTTHPLVVVQDGARYPTAKDVQTFCAAQAARLTVVQLPRYSPDYNPIEHLWRAVKRAATHNRSFAPFEAMGAAVEECLASFQNQPLRVKALLGTPLDTFVPPSLAA